MLQPAVSRALRRTIVGLVGASALFVAVMAFAHTKPGRPLLHLMFGPGPSAQAKGESGDACPLGFGGTAATPEARDAARQQAVKKLRGQTPAAARPALGFDFEKTTRADVDAWAAKHSIKCQKPKFGADLDCSGVPPRAFLDSQVGLEASSVWFRFDSHDKLVDVEAVHYTYDLDAGSSSFAGLLNTLTTKLGPPSNTLGEPTPEYLSKGLLSLARASYAFSDYRVDASAMQIAEGKYMITEKYKSLNLLFDKPQAP